MTYRNGGDKTHARKLIKQKINLKMETQIMPQPHLFILWIIDDLENGGVVHIIHQMVRMGAEQDL